MSNEALKAWSDDVALRGPEAPKNDGSIKHLIEYLLTVYERFGDTQVTESISLQWGATALHKQDEQKDRIAQLERDVEAAKRQACTFEGREGCSFATSLAALPAGYAELKLAAEDFIAKVESGRARSTDSYGKFKAAISLIVK